MLVARNLTSMQNLSEPKLSKWPFVLGDLLLLGAACFIVLSGKTPISSVRAGLLVLCVGAGAVMTILPFILEFRLIGRLAEGKALTTAVAQLENLEKVGTQISAATARWQSAQAEADKVAAAAKTIADRMNAEVQAFTEFMQRINDSEKTTLKLEVEKLHRAENDWLQVLVRTLDHVYALQVGASRSGQPKLIEQLGHFQSACREAARRVGLTPFAATPTEPFDTERHQVLEQNGTPPAGAAVAETIATGYTFQGRLLRPALVRLQENGHTPAPDPGTAEIPKSDQSDLALDAPGAGPA